MPKPSRGLVQTPLRLTKAQLGELKAISLKRRRPMATLLRQCAQLMIFRWSLQDEVEQARQKVSLSVVELDSLADAVAAQVRAGEVAEAMVLLDKYHTLHANQKADAAWRQAVSQQL